MSKEKSMQKALNGLKELAEEREWSQFHTLENLAKSICLEAAELLEHFQWSHEAEDQEAMIEELADVLSYCLQMCNTLDLDPEEIVLKKLEKTKKKYPVDKAKGKATKYNQL